MLNKLRILICDDEERFITPLKEYITEYMASRSIPCEIVTNVHAQQIFSSTEVFDIAFLDIQMPEIDGLTLAKELRRRNGKTALFFITNYEEYQDNAMDLQALRYFTKPFDPNRLQSGLDKAMEYIDGAYIDIYLHSEGIQQRVLVDDIIYLTLEKRKVAIQTTKNHFMVTGKLEEWVDRFPQFFFRQVHKSFLINLHYVEVYSYSEVIMTGGIRIPIAPKKQAEFRKIWFEYLGRR